jgi:hypothetical protein
MYQTTTQLISISRALKDALLLSLITDQSIHIETGSAGCVPLVLDKPNQIILNRHYALQMVPASEVQKPEARFLTRQFLGKRILIVTNYDGLAAQPKVPFEQCIMLDIRSDSVPALPQSIRARAAFSLSVSLPPDAVVELINYVTESAEFEGDKIFALKAFAGTAARTGGSFRQSIAAIVNSTREGTEEYQQRVKAGINASFGDGAPVRCTQDLFAACCADAAIRGRTEFGKEDIIRLIAPVVAHRISGTDGKAAGYGHELKKIAAWAVSV